MIRHMTAIGEVGLIGLLALALTASELTAIAVAVTALIAAIFAGVVNILTVLRTERKVDEVHAKAAVIEGHVNSAASTSAAKIDALQKDVAGLHALIAEQTQTAALLAQAAASRVRGVEGGQ